MTDETVEQRGRRVTAERAARKFGDVLDEFVVRPVSVTAVDGVVCLMIDPADVDKLAEEVSELRWEAHERLVYL